MNKHRGDNIGTFHSLYIAKVKDLTDMNFDAQKFTEIYFTAQTGQWQRKTKASKNGNYFEHQLVFDVPKYRQEVENFLLDYVRVGLIAYIVLTNGEFVRIGSLQSPLFILIDTDGGKNNQDFNSYSFKGTATEAIGMTKNAGIVVTPPPPPPIILAEGLKFDGIGHYVTSNLSIDMSNDFSFSFIIQYFTSQPYYFVIGNLTNRIQIDSTQMRVLFTRFGINLPAYTSNIIFNNGEITHCAITKNNNTISFYKNGQLQNSVFITNPSSAMCTNLLIGTEAGIGAFANQNIYDLKPFNKTLTQAEITELFNNKTIPITALANTLANYEFKEKTGTIIYDTSGNNFHAQMVNYYPHQYNLGTDNHHVNPNGNPMLS